MATRLKRRIWVLVGGVAAAALLVALLIPAIPPNESSKSDVYLCTRCGIRRWVEETTTVDEPPGLLLHREELLPTDLSRWHADHYPEPCLHQWRLNHLVHRRYRRVGSLNIPHDGGLGSFVTPRLINLSEPDAAFLEAMFAADPIVCQFYIEFCLQPRRDRNSKS